MVTAAPNLTGIDALAYVVEREFSYKPHIKIEILDREHLHVTRFLRLRYTMTVLDVNDPAKVIDVMNDQPFSDQQIKEMDVPKARVAVFQLVKFMEDHERDEWLKFNGEQFNDTHEEGR